MICHNLPDGYTKTMKKVFQGDIHSVWQWEQELFDGSKKRFEKIGRPDATRVLGVLPDGRILLVWDEQPQREGVLTLAGGQIDEGEDPAPSAAWEFLEETGYKVASPTPWLTWQPVNWVSNTIHFFIGRDVEYVSEPLQSAGERTGVRLFTFDEFIALGKDESLREMRIRIMLLEAQIDPNKKKELYALLYE